MLTLLIDSLRGLASCDGSLGFFGLDTSFGAGVGEGAGITGFGDVGSVGIAGGNALKGGGTADCAIGIIGAFSGSSSGSWESGMGFRKSAASILAVTASKSSMM